MLSGDRAGAGPDDHRHRDRRRRRRRARPDPGRRRPTRTVPVLGITGTGGSGKSSLTDELVRRLRMDQHDKRAGRRARGRPDPAPRRRRAARRPDPDEQPRPRRPGIDRDRVFFRSLATRGAHELPEHLADVIAAAKAAGFDLVDRRDAGHRPGRRGGRAVRRHLPLRHDAGVRRRVAAREDRHARLRRRRRDQQVRAARRRGRAARRRPPAGPQPRGVRPAARGHAGVRHLGRDLRRRRRDRALPAPARRS